MKFMLVVNSVLKHPLGKENSMTRIGTVLMAGLLMLPLFACQTQHKVEVAPMEVKPIHITIDVNVKVDRALEDFFEDIDAEADRYQPSKPPAE